MLKRPSGIIHALVLMLAHMCLCGCATCFPQNSLRFRTVDAATGKPLEGVLVERRSSNRTIGVPFFAGTAGSFSLPASNKNGTVVADKLCHDLMHDFQFQKAGYLDAHAHWAEGDQIVLDLPPTDPHHNQRGRFASAKGVVEIKMYVEGIKVGVYTPVWIATTNPPAAVVLVAEQASQKQHPGESNQWHGIAGALRSFKNQYGDYRVVWLARDEARGGFQWQWVDITPPDEVTRYVSGADHTASAPPDLENLNGWRER